VSAHLVERARHPDSTIEGDIEMLEKARSSRAAQLRLEDGSTVSVILSLVRSDGRRTLQVSGPVARLLMRLPIG